MSTASVSSARATSLSRNQLLGIGAAAAIVHALIMIPGYSENGSFQTAGWLTSLAVALVFAAVLFLAVVPRGKATAGLVVAVLSVVSIAAFWVMVTLPLSAAAVVFGRRESKAGGGRKATVTWVLGVVAAAVLVAVVIGDQTS